MLKRILTLAFLATSSCTKPGVDKSISTDQCWGTVSNGQKISGTATLNYFPENSAFISNTACPSNTIGVSLRDADSNMVTSLIKSRFSRGTLAGVLFEVKISGVVKLNKNLPRPILLIDEITIAYKADSPKPIYIK